MINALTIAAIQNRASKLTAQNQAIIVGEAAVAANTDPEQEFNLNKAVNQLYFDITQNLIALGSVATEVGTEFEPDESYGPFLTE